MTTRHTFPSLNSHAGKSSRKIITGPQQPVARFQVPAKSSKEFSQSPRRENPSVGDSSQWRYLLNSQK
jgi:hypothetical protein